MKVVRIHGPDDVRVDELPIPEVGPGDVLLRVRACGVCGTDLHYIRDGGCEFVASDGGPTALGHEAAGEVVAVGSRVSCVSPGDRVFVNPVDAVSGVAIGNGAGEGAFAEFLLVRNADQGRLLRLADDMPFDHAALVEPVSVAVHAIRRSGWAPGEKVAVLGVGPIGAAVVAWLKAEGAEDIVAVDLSSDRLARAARLGAASSLLFDRDRFAEDLAVHHGSAPGSQGPATDLFIDATGSPQAFDAIIRMAKRGARVTVLGLLHGPVATDVNAIVLKELTVTGSVGYPSETGEVLEFLARNPGFVRDYVSHRYAFEEVLAAFEAARDPAAGKVMVEMEVRAVRRLIEGFLAPTLS